MSTTFGIYRHPGSIELIDDCLPQKYEDEDFTVVARRSNGMRWEGLVAALLPDDTKVYPLDNSAQGVYTIGDIRKEVQKRK